MKTNRHNKILLWLLPAVVGLVMRLWFATCRVKIHGTENFPHPGEEKNTPIIVSFWHYSIIFILFFLRRYEATVLVSASDDGDYFSRLAEHFGYTVLRGSKNRKGVQALKGLLGAARNGSSCALVADGSQGPPLILQPGALLLASRTGLPIIPIAWSASSYITLHSWDRLAIPRPFAKIHYLYGKPIYVPDGLKEAALEKYREKVEQELLTLYQKAWAIFGQERHDQE